MFENTPLLKNELIFLDDGNDMDIFSNAKSEMYVLVIEKELFFSTFDNYFSKSVKDVLKNKHFCIEEDKILSFAQKLCDWMNYLESKEFLELNDKPYNDIESEIITNILSYIKFETREKQRNKFQVKKVRDILHESICDKVSISTIIDELDIGQRQLYNSFKLNYGLTPKKYLQNLRLNAVRKELLLADPKNTTISDIAYKYGFTHMSHFTSEYKKMFKVLPSKHLQKN